MTDLPPPAEEGRSSLRTSPPPHTPAHTRAPKGILQALQSLQVQCLQGQLGSGLLVHPEAGWVSKLGSRGCQGPQRGLRRPCLPFPGLTPAAAENPDQPPPAASGSVNLGTHRKRGEAAPHGRCPQLQNFILKVNPLKRSPK